MRNFIATAIIAIASCGAANAADTMYVTTASGVTPLALTDVANVVFPDAGGLIVTHQAGTSTVFKADEFHAITFDPAINSISEITADKYDIAFDGTVLTSLSDITLYNIDGTQVTGVGGTRISVANLSAGVYIATTKSSTLKFIKR